MNEIILYKSPLKALRLIGLSSIFVIPSIYFVTTQDSPKTIFWVSIVFFGLGYIVGLISLFDRRPQIIITSKGIWDRRLKIEPISWDDIYDAYLFHIKSQHFISLVVNETISEKIKSPKWVTVLNQEIGAQKINLNVSDLKVNKEKLLTSIEQLYSEQHGKRPEMVSKLNLE